MKKKLLLFITSVALAIGSIAQTEKNLPDPTGQTLVNAPYVFKGTVTNRAVPFMKENDNQIYLSYNIEVETIYKNNEELKLGSVELICKASNLWYFRDGEFGEMELTHYDKTSSTSSVEFRAGFSGVFVCNKSNTNQSLKSSVTNNTITIIPVCNTMNCIFQYWSGYIHDDNGQKLPHRYIKGFNQKFEEDGKLIYGRPTWEDELTVWDKLETYLKNYGIEPLNRSIPPLNVKTLEQNSKNKLLYQERIKNFEKHKQLLEQRYQNSLNSTFRIKDKSTKATESVTFNVANQQLSGTTTQYFEFDIMVSGSSTYLDNAAFVIAYRPEPFGTNISANNKVTITKGANFNTSTYGDPTLSVIDDTDASIRFYLGIDYSASSWNRRQITNSEQQLVHIKMELVNCFGVSGIDFLETASTSNVALYTTSPTANPFSAPVFAYNTVDYVPPTTFAFCPPPFVLSVSPQTVTAGTNSMITITGLAFGEERGTGHITLANADLGGSADMKEFDDIDYVSWSDTEIKFIVPSKVDNGTRGTVGTGDIGIIRNDGVVTPLTGFNVPIEVTYSNHSRGRFVGTSQHIKAPMRAADFVPTDPSKDMVFHLDASITDNPKFEKYVRKALKDWSCVAKVNWTIGENVNAKHTLDNLNVIYIDDDFHGIRSGGTYRDGASFCTDANGNSIVVYKDIDIGLTRDFTALTDGTLGWFFDSTFTKPTPIHYVDFLLTIEHELGHALGLNHVIDNTDLMHFGRSTQAEIPASNRFDIYKSINSANGGKYIVNESSSINDCNGISGMTPASPINCGVGVGINDYLDEMNLMLYPNPGDDIVHISFELKQNSNVNINLYDALGNQVKSINSEGSRFGLQDFDLDINEFSSGFYLLKVQINDHIENVKLIIN